LGGRELANFIVKIIRDKKGRDISLLSVRNFLIIGDYFIISTIEVPEHGEAIVEEIRKRARDYIDFNIFTEKDKYGDWIVVDCGSVIVHLMTEDKRLFYQIDSLLKEHTKTNVSSMESKDFDKI
jgi:ribosome-associated protein